MATQLKRTSLTLRPDWDEDLNRLKKEMFYNKTFSDLLRYLIELGLDTAKEKGLLSKTTA